MDINSTLFKSYANHVLKWEGGLSNNPSDSAASCAPYAGAYHTNRGVTYCTYLSIGPALGYTPNYQSFLNLTDADATRFLYYFYKGIKADKIPDFVGLAMTEAAWGSGPERAVIHLQQAINDLGGSLVIDGDIGPKTISAANSVDPDQLYNQYWIRRKDYINYLLSFPAYDQFKSGWIGRINDFLAQFSPAGGSMLIIGLITIGGIIYISSKRKTKSVKVRRR